MLKLHPNILFPIRSENAEWGGDVYKNGFTKMKDVPLLIGW